MNTMKPREWFQARLKWAVMEEGLGLTRWREAEHIFLSENRDTAFQEALRLGYTEEHSLIPNEDDDRNPEIDFRFAEVVYLEELGIGRTAFEVHLGERQATEQINFDHVFEPEGRLPQPIF
jgi:hypothetical protein